MTNTQADRVKEVARLAGRPSRLRRREFLAEGPQAVREALRLHLTRVDAGAGGVVVDFFATDEALARHDDIAELLVHPTAPRLRMVTPEVLAAMSSTVTPQGFIAVCRFVDTPLDEILASGPRLVAVLVEVRDPGNAGTIIRAADAAGADAVILTGGSVDLYNPKTVRSTVGSVFHLGVVTGADVQDLPARLRAAGLTILAADGHGSSSLDDLQEASESRRFAGSQGDGDSRPPSSGGDDPQPPTPQPTTPWPTGEPSRSVAAASSAADDVRLEDPAAWLFGNEAQGLADTVTAAADARVAVPIYGSAESLNVGTAATVCLYASARAQRAR
ncbi:TrmH family RNA methyltransferase [Arthrobacter echini]